MPASPLKGVPVAFSVGEVAELLGCSTDTVRRMIAANQLPAVQPLGRGGRIFVGRAQVEGLFDVAAAASGAPGTNGSDRTTPSGSESK